MRKSRPPVESHHRGLFAPPEASRSPCLTNTTPTTPAPKSGQHRWSIMSITSLKPARGKLQKLWPASSTSPSTKSPSSPSSPSSDYKDWGQSDLSAVIRLAGLQMSALGNPANPVPAGHQDDSKTSGRGFRRSCAEDAAQPMALPPPSRAPPPPPAPRPYSHHGPCSSPLVPWSDEVPPPPSLHRQRPLCPVPSPDRAPPPPPLSAPRPMSPRGSYSYSMAPLSEEMSPPSSPNIQLSFQPAPTQLPSELSPVNYDVYDEREHALSCSPKRPISMLRRRAKTPVHQIGQLERAARHSRQGTSGLNRTSSVSTIARQYRELVVPEDDVDDGQLSDGSFHDLVEPRTPREHSRSTSLESANYSWRSSQLTPSLMSDDGTLVALEEEPVEDAYKPAAWSPLPCPSSSNKVVAGPDEDEMPAPAAMRFNIGLDLLTRELSSTMGEQAKREGRDAYGLQIWVMIEAYERLRHQIAAAGPRNEGAKEAIDSWLQALHAIHRDLADEAAMSESEYSD